MRLPKKGENKGFTLIELMILLLLAVFGLVVLTFVVILAVYLIGGYLVLNPRPDRVYDGGAQQRQEQSTLVLPADDEELAAVRDQDGDSGYCLCLLKDRTQCVECTLADAAPAALEPVPVNDNSLWLPGGGEA